MGIIVADSGSTKCSWRLVKGDEVRSFSSIGINPVFRTEQECFEIIDGCFPEEERSGIESIFFYGAGCSSPERKNKIQQALAKIFHQAEIAVEHDILASCRALCGNEPGMAAILGTGTNTCIYDGKVILENIPAMGYILGDEGSGSYLGRRLLTDYFRGLIPESVKSQLDKKFDLNKDLVIQKVYSEAAPNRYLASFAEFIIEHKKEAYFLNLIKSGFEDFFQYHVARYQNYHSYQLHLVGSVAYYNREILEKIAYDFNVSLGKVIKEPIAALTLYHAPHLDY